MSDNVSREEALRAIGLVCGASCNHERCSERRWFGQAIRSLPAAEPAMVPWKGERELAEAIDDALMQVLGKSAPIRLGLSIAIARTVISHGIAFDAEKAAVALVDHVEKADPNPLNKNDLQAARECVKAILAAGLGAASQGDPK